MLLDCDIDREHEKNENSRKRHFDHRSQLNRKEIAELAGLVDDRS
jgi:hypothetical protein